jgi:KRAB domain-containing zinc finger protein
VTHSFTHTGVRPYQCDFPECEYACKTIGSLNMHIRTHTGERPYVCGECNASFTQATHLRSHAMTHTGERPFRCDFPQCTYACARRDDLKTHFITRTGARPFKCDAEGCEGAFTTSPSLARHKRRFHTGPRQGLQKTKENRLSLALLASGVTVDHREFIISFECIGGTFARLDFLIQKFDCIQDV